MTGPSDRTGAAPDPLPVAAGGLLLPMAIVLVPLAAHAVLYFLLPVIAPAMMLAMGRPPEDYGWVGGALGGGSLVFLLISFAITPALGPVGSLRLGLMIGIAGGMFIFSGIWPLVLIGGGLIGLGYGSTTPSGSQVLADFTPRSTWGTLFSLRQAGVPAGGVVAAGLGGILVEGYGWVPALEGALAVLAAATLFMSLVPTRFNHARPLVTFEPRRLLTMQALTRPARVVWSTPGLPRLVGAGAGFAMSHGAVTQFMVVYFNSGLGLPLERAAALFAIMQTCAIFGRVVFGAIADRIGSPLLVLTALAPLSALCCLSLTVFDPAWSLPMHVAFALAVGCAVGTWNGLYLAEVARCAAPEKISVTTASASFFTFSAYTVTPPLVGLLARAIGWRPTFALIAVAPLMGALLLRQAVRLPRSFEP